MSFKKSGFDWPRGATSLLIDLYEGYPCLYLPTLPDYHNRNIRLKALEEITKKFNRRQFTTISIEDIKRKIHGIRAQFLAELKKIKNSQVSGASADTIYVPKLWCFDQLQFLQPGCNLLSRGDSNLPASMLDSREELMVPQETSREEIEFPEIKDETTIAEVENWNLERNPLSPDIPEPILFASASTSTSPPETPSRDGVQQRPSSIRKRKRTIQAVEEQQHKLSNLLATAVNTLDGMNRPEVQRQVNVKKHASFGEWILDEMEQLEDDDIIDDLKQEIIQSVYRARKLQRQKNKME